MKYGTVSCTTLFFVTTVTDGSNETTGWRVYGAGLGHGVGMSQIGAVTMANGGKTFEEILARYYTGVVLEERY